MRYPARETMYNSYVYLRITKNIILVNVKLVPAREMYDENNELCASKPYFAVEGA